MTKQNKIDLLTKLVKEGHITLCEAFELSETKTEYVVQSANVQWIPSKPNPYLINGTNKELNYEKF
jgi:hypothetical protein